MIYLDNSATTYPKPMSVKRAVSQALDRFGANPGRSGHKMSLSAENQIYRCRQLVADMFYVSKPEDIVFTHNCTYAINFVLKGLLKSGNHVVVSNLEHNAVMRPLKKLESMGVTYSIAKVFPEDNDKTLDSFRNAINSKTALIICTHASNVWGIKLPIERIAALSHINNIPILVDAAQTAGIIPINLRNSNIDFLCIAGHKGLYGPCGTGMLITSQGDKLDTIIEGGTGINSKLLCQLDKMPQKFECGTPNVSGICGLMAGIEFVQKNGINNIFNHELRLMTYLYDNLKNIKNIKLYTPKPTSNYSVPVLSFNVVGYKSKEIGQILDKHGIAIRAGLHCAPEAHRFYNTIDIGAVRVSPSIFSNKSHIDSLIRLLKSIPNKK